VKDADGEDDEEDEDNEDAEEGSSSESEWEEVVDGEAVDTGEAEEEKTDGDSDSERLSSEADAGTCEEYDEIFSFLFSYFVYLYIRVSQHSERLIAF